MSLRYMLNNRGPRMEPGGIPDFMSVHELKELLTLLLCFLPDR